MYVVIQCKILTISSQLAASVDDDTFLQEAQFTPLHYAVIAEEVTEKTRAFIVECLLKQADVNAECEVSIFQSVTVDISLDQREQAVLHGILPTTVICHSCEQSGRGH